MMNAVFLALALLVIPMAGFAQSRVSAQSTSLDVSIDGPVWIEDAQNSLQSGVGTLGNPVVISEFIPQGQSFDNWQELFAIMIEESPGLTLDQYKGQQIGRFVGVCDLDPSHIYSFETEPHYTVFVVPCGNYKASPQTGEVALFFMATAETHFIKIYQHFRGPAFEPLDASQWPIDEAAVQHFLTSLSGVAVTTR